MLNTQVGRERGQTEPLAALVSIAALCIAISLYAGFASSLVPEFGGDQRTEQATLDSVWAAVSEDGLVESDAPLESIDPEAMPRGLRVSVTVTIVGENGRLERVDSRTFDERGSPAALNPPKGAPTTTRPVPVRVADGDIRPGQLVVVVWDG